MKVTCFGAGIIGASWATNFAIGGCEVYLYDLQKEFLERAKGQILRNLRFLEAHDCLTGKDPEAIVAGIVFTTDAELALQDAEFVQEAGPEKLEIKQAMAATIEQYAPAECLIASSTSGLSISRIAEKTAHPERFVGAHPFNPPHLIPLVEMTCGEKTAPENAKKAAAFYRSQKKEPIILKKEKPGFVANRLSHAVLREVMSLVNEGVCTPEEADKALVYGPGLRWASLGQIMIGELGSPGGNREAAVRFKALNEMIFSDLENRVTLPENWGEISAIGAETIMKNNGDVIGHTKEEAAEFRDDVLVELLKLHKKF